MTRVWRCPKCKTEWRGISNYREWEHKKECWPDWLKERFNFDPDKYEEIEDKNMNNEKSVEEYSFLCRQCQAINDSPIITEIEEVISNMNPGEQSMVDRISIARGETKDDLDEEEIKDIEESDHHTFEKKLFWICGLCKHKHKIPEEGQFNRI